MLEFDDNVADPQPAVETFGIQPIGLERAAPPRPVALESPVNAVTGAPSGPARL